MISRKQFDNFYQLLIEWNKVMESFRGLRNMGSGGKAFVDSLSLVEVTDVRR